MARSLQDLSVASIIQAIEDNFIEFILTYVRVAGGEFIEESGLTKVYSGMLMSYFNGVIRTKLINVDIHAAIENTLAYFSILPHPMIWWITSSALPYDLDIHLKAHGLNFIGQDVGMAIDLLNIQEIPTASVDLAIEVVHEEQDLKDWLYVYRKGFELSREVTDDYGRHLALILSSQHPIGPYYLARFNGRAVGTASLCITEDVAGIYEVATLPSMCRQGIGTATVLAALREARSQGYKIGVLQAAKMGVSLYRRLGFRDYCFFDAYTKPHS